MVRRPVVIVLIGLGAFFLALAPLVRFYVADQMVRAPLNRYQVTRLEARDASYFDMATLKIKTGATLRAANTVRGDVRANAGNNDVAVWDSSTTISDATAPDKPIQTSSYRIAFDRKTSALVRCCGAGVDGDTSVRMSGYALLFPLANVQRRDYNFFDMTTRRSVPMRYSGEEDVSGIKAYKFVQNVPNTKTSSLDVKLPARMLGMNPELPDQQVDRYSALNVTVWVDPRTGIPLRHRQVIDSTVRTADGRGVMTVAKAELHTTPESVKSAVDTANTNAFQIAAVRGYIPIGVLFVGLVLILVGGIVGLVGAGRRPPSHGTRRSDGKYGEPAPGAPVNAQR